MHGREKGVAARNRQNALLGDGTLDVVILNQHVLFQDLGKMERDFGRR